MSHAPSTIVTVIVPAQAAVLSVLQMRDHLLLGDATEQDAYIQALIVAAYDRVERHLEASLLTQTLEASIDRVPCEDVWLLPRGPVQAISSVTAYYDDGTSSAMSASTYYLADDRLCLSSAAAWPTFLRRRRALVARYTAGFTSADLVPQTIVHAMRLLVAHWFTQRQIVADGGLEVPETVEALLAPHRLTAGVA